MPLPFLILIYVVLAGGLVFLSDKLGNYIDLLDKKTKMSGAFLGGVLLAAVTSLPELFTSISATLFVHEKDLVVGNVLGSNLFNLSVLGFCLLLFFKSFHKSKIDYKSHYSTLIGVIIIYALIFYALLVPAKYQPVIGPINLICPLTLIIYGLVIYLQPKSEEKEEEKIEENNEEISPLSVKQIIIRFCVCAVLLVSVSIAITYATDALGEALNLSATVAGALFLAIATSLPELVSCFTLCRKGNFNAALGDIFGSCFFNFCIIGIGEFLSYDGTLITQNDVEAINMAIIAFIVIILSLIFLLIKNIIIDKKEKSKTCFNVLTIAFGSIALLGYIVYLII